MIGTLIDRPIRELLRYEEPVHVMVTQQNIVLFVADDGNHVVLIFIMAFLAGGIPDNAQHAVDTVKILHPISGIVLGARDAVAVVVRQSDRMVVRRANFLEVAIGVAMQ